MEAPAQSSFIDPTVASQGFPYKQNYSKRSALKEVFTPLAVSLGTIYIFKVSPEFQSGAVRKLRHLKVVNSLISAILKSGMMYSISTSLK